MNSTPDFPWNVIVFYKLARDADGKPQTLFLPPALARNVPAGNVARPVATKRVARSKEKDAIKPPARRG
jgi:hypothetical protein